MDVTNVGMVRVSEFHSVYLTFLSCSYQISVCLFVLNGFCSLLLPSVQQNEVTDSAYLGSESTYSECETFTDEDTGALVPPEMHEDVETDSGIEATLHDPEDGANR